MAMTEISYDEFWDHINELQPLLRLGYREGPGAFINSEPWNLRRCEVTGKMDYTYSVYVVLKNADSEVQYFEHDEPMTLNEFKAFCDRVMPGIGICGMLWGNWLLDEYGNVRDDLEYPVRHTDRDRYKVLHEVKFEP